MALTKRQVEKIQTIISTASESHTKGLAENYLMTLPEEELDNIIATIQELES